MSSVHEAKHVENGFEGVVREGQGTGGCRILVAPRGLKAGATGLALTLTLILTLTLGGGGLGAGSKSYLCP